MKNFGFVKKIMFNLQEVGYKEWTPVQEKIIPVILKNKDVLGCAQTGTGKTATFALPIINNIYISNIKNNVLPKDYRKTQALILAPTRDLSLQIFNNIKNYAKKMNIKSLCVYGGVPKSRQVKMLAEGCEIVIGTPGRILDLIKDGYLKLDDVKYRVLDEVDHMLDIGFLDDITNIINRIENPDLTIMLSATIPKTIENLAKDFLKPDYEYIQVSKTHSVAKTIEQFAILTKPKNFISLIIEFIKEDKTAIIFTRTKLEVDNLSDKLIAMNLKVAAIHGDKEQWNRNLAINDFKQKKASILIATNVLARGIDIPNVDYVFNYHLPEDIESYVHRIGRTGRASMFGTAISLIDESEIQNLAKIQLLTKDKVKVYKIDHIEQLENCAEYELPKVETHQNYQRKYNKGKKKIQKKFKIF